MKAKQAKPRQPQKGKTKTSGTDIVAANQRPTAIGQRMNLGDVFSEKIIKVPSAGTLIRGKATDEKLCIAHRAANLYKRSDLLAFAKKAGLDEGENFSPPRDLAGTVKAFRKAVTARLNKSEALVEKCQTLDGKASKKRTEKALTSAGAKGVTAKEFAALLKQVLSTKAGALMVAEAVVPLIAIEHEYSEQMRADLANLDILWSERNASAKGTLKRKTAKKKTPNRKK